MTRRNTADNSEINQWRTLRQKSMKITQATHCSTHHLQMEWLWLNYQPTNTWHFTKTKKGGRYEAAKNPYGNSEGTTGIHGSGGENPITRQGLIKHSRNLALVVKIVEMMKESQNNSPTRFFFCCCCRLFLAYLPCVWQKTNILNVLAPVRNGSESIMLWGSF